MALPSRPYYGTIDVNANLPLSRFSEIFTACFDLCYTYDKNPVIVLCIGTDRSTGDCLGPLVGHKLTTMYSSSRFLVYGTLEEPVHAKNLNETLEKIRSRYPNPFIIAVDASLGSMERIGHITIGKGPLKPGAGVKKTLPSVGDMHISGIVNFGGFMEYLILQNTRLGLVMKMANVISSGIHYSFRNVMRNLPSTLFTP